MKSIFIIFLFTVFSSSFLFGQQQPSSVTVVSRTDKQISIRWNWVTGEHYYDILRANSPLGNYIIIEEGKEANSSQEAIYTDTGLTPNNEYCYRVRISGTTGSSPNVCATTFSPDPPQTYSISGKVLNQNSAVEGVKVSLNNLIATYSSTTNSSGFYSITGVTEGFSGKLEASKYGCTINDEFDIVDLQGNISNKDFTNLNCPVTYLVDISSPNNESIWNTETSYDIVYQTNIKDENITVRLLNENLSLVYEQSPPDKNTGRVSFKVPSFISSGNYFISVEGEESGIDGRSELFTILNNVLPDNNPPKLISSDVSPRVAEINENLTFTCTWTDDENNFIVEAKLQLIAPNNSLNEYSLTFVEGTNPPQFTTQLSLTTEGEYTYKFQAADKENLSDSQPIHAPVWITAGSFTVNGPTSNNCTFPDLDNSAPSYDAINYLCNLNVINGDDETGLIRPNDAINRAELAKVAYKSIELENASFADFFPCPYNDLQDEKDSWYYSFAKNLLYLEYDNGVPPFDRNRFNFYPSNQITRAHVLKVLLETWNIPILSGSNPFNDVLSEHEVFDYLFTAFQRNLIGETARPNDNCTRAEAFEFLYQIMNNTSTPVISLNDFYIPENNTPQNFNQTGGVGFPYSKQSFYIPGRNLAISFGHKYLGNSYDIPEELLALRPLGINWTHSYNYYLMEIEGDIERPVYDNRVIIAFPDGSFNSFQFINGKYQCLTLGVFNELEKISPYQYNYTTSNGVVYSFVKIRSTEEGFPFVLTSVTDKNNNQITISWEDSYSGSSKKRISQVTGTAGRSLNFEYHNGSDLVKEVTDPINRKIKFSYDDESLNENARLFGFVDAKSQTTMYQYATQGEAKYLLQGIILPKGNYIAAGYEGRKLKSISSSENVINISKTTNFENPGSSNYTSFSITDRNQKNLGTLNFDDKNNLTSKTTPGNSVSVDYDASFPTLPENINSNGIASEIEYDTNGNISSITIDGKISKYICDNDNRITSYTDAKGNKYDWDYDNNGNLIKTITPLGTTSIYYNEFGQPVYVKNPEGVITQNRYDNFGNLTRQDFGEGIIVSYTYDYIGRLKTKIQPDGQTISMQYDNNDNVQEVVDGNKLVYGYDQNDNMTSIINVKDQLSELIYSEKEDYLEDFNYGGMNKNMSYDAKGRLATFIDPSGQVFTYTYNDNELLENVEVSGENLHYDYTINNLLETITYNDKNTRFTYDNLERLKTTTDIYNSTVSYTYNDNNQKETITYPGAKQVTYNYENNLITSVNHWTGTMTYTYRKDGLLKRVDYPNNTFGEYAFDEAGRVTGILWKKANGDTIFSSNYVLNPAGLPIQEERQSAIHPDSIQVEEMELNYTFDQSNNEILTFGNDAVQHDDNGNVIQIGNEQYVWDEYNRLVENPDYYYEYDGLGNRKQKTNKSTGEITRYILDTNADMSWVLAEANSSNQIQYHYIYGNGLNARIDATGNTSYYHYDLRGNIIAITNQAGEITHKYEYSPYGRVIYKKEADFNPFRFVGQYGVEYENEDLYFMRARYYKPLMGRFLNVDPIYNPENLFVYADNNPLKNIDPQGTEPFSSILNFYIILRDYSKDNPPGSNSLTTGDALFMLTDFVNETRSLGMGFVDVSKILVGNNKMTMSSYYFKGAGNFSSGTKLTGAGKGNVFVSIAMGTWERGRKMHKKIKNDEFDFIDIPKMIGATALDGLIGLFPAASVASSFIEAKYHKKPSDAIFDFAEEFGESLGSDLYDLFH